MDIRQELFNNRDLNYRDFHKKLVPDIDEQKIIGVRLPVMRKIAKSAAGEGTSIDAPYYYEEQMIKGLIIGYSHLTIGEYMTALDAFVPLIDNWAVCDSVCSNLKFTKNHLTEMWEYISKYLRSDREYELRFAIVMLMTYYLSDDYITDVLIILKSLYSTYYYVNMATAWALSIAYISYPEAVKIIIENKELQPWVHNKTISKICDSYRVSKSDKDYLKTLRIK